MHARELQRPIRNYDQAEAFLLGLVREDPRPYASHAHEGITLLLKGLGNPHSGMRFLHIAGSKGKGSVSLMSEALFEAHGISTATFTSPHLRRWTERFRIGGEEIPTALFIDALESIRPLILDIIQHTEEDIPSFFDVLSAAALIMFRDAGVDVAIIECGLGGRYDATNVIHPELCCITSIELEHVDKLGHDLASIASHKAGIIKHRTPVVCGSLPLAAMSVVELQAHQQQAPLYRYGVDFEIEQLSNTSAEVQSLRYTATSDLEIDFNLNCYGKHMAENAAVALTLLRHINSTDSKTADSYFNPENIAHCFDHLSLPGRGQILSRDPCILIDAAHTPSSLNLLAEHLSALNGGSRHFLISATHGKNLQALASLLKTASRVYVTCVDPLRSMPGFELCDGLTQLYPDLKMTCIEDPKAAIESARQQLKADGILCICGSVYLAGFALDHLKD